MNHLLGTRGIQIKVCVEAIYKTNPLGYKEFQYSYLAKKGLINEYLHKMIFYISCLNN